MTAEKEVPVLSSEAIAGMLHVILSATDNTERRTVEANVIQLLGHPQTLMHLVTVLCDTQGTSAGVRQLAAVLLRKKIFSLWKALPEETRTELRHLLQQQLSKEEVRVVRFSIAHVVTRLVKADASRGGGGWPELQCAIRDASLDPRVEIRELAMVLVYSIAEVFFEENAMVGFAAESVVRGMADTAPIVQKAAVKAAMALLPFISSKHSVMAGLLPQLLSQSTHILHGCAAEEQQTALCVSVLDVLELLGQDLSVKRYGNVLVSIVNLLAELMANSTVQPRVRQAAGDALSQIVMSKSGFVVSHNLLVPLVTVCMRVMGEDDTIAFPSAEDEGLDQDDEGSNDSETDGEDLDLLHVPSPCIIGGRLLSRMATSIPPKRFTSALLPFVSVAEKLDANPFERKAAMVALACLAEGNASYLRRRVGYVLSTIQSYLNDASPVLREAGAFALSYFCVHLQPEILTHHAELFPMLVPLLVHEESDPVRRRVADALDKLCENVAEDLEPYLPVLLPATMDAIGRSSLATQKGLCGVLSSMGMTRCPAFLTFGPSLLELLKTPLSLTSRDTVSLRAQATETVGVIAAAVGHDLFAPYFPFYLEKVVENLHSPHAVLREQSFGFLANVCELLKASFLPYLDDAVGCALASMATDKVVYSNKHLLAAADVPFAIEDAELTEPSGQGGHPNGDSGDDESDEGGDPAEEIHMRVRTADVEEKCAAVHCIGVFAESLLEHFGSERVTRCWEAVLALDAHFYPGVRSNALLTAAKLTKATHGSAEVVKALQEDTLSPQTRARVTELVNEMLVPSLQAETEKDVLSATGEALCILLDFFGPQALPHGADEVVRLCIRLLRQDASFQRLERLGSDTDEDDGDDPFDQCENGPSGEGAATSWLSVMTPEQVVHNVQLNDAHDELLDSVAELVEALAKTYGQAFEPYARYLVPLLSLYVLGDERPPEDVVMGMGTLAIVLQHLGPAAEHFFDCGIQLAFDVIAKSDESTARANASYLLRVLIEGCPQRFAQAAAVHETLQSLWAVAGSTDEIPQAVDNAISATCSLVRCLPPSMVPFDSVISAMLVGVPMKLDHSENANAAKTLVYLLTSLGETALTARWLPDVVACVANVLLGRRVEAAVKQALVQDGARVFAQQHPELWCKLRGSLFAEQLAALEAEGL